MQYLQEVQFQSMPDKVAAMLRTAILNGALKPGERLIEYKLAGQFGIGQPTLREALKELEIQGFVRKVPNKGTFITQLTKEDFRNSLEVRLTLEVLAIERATLRMTPEASEELEAIVGKMAKAADSFDLATFHDSDVEFHRRIWELSGNEYIVMALERFAFALFAFVLLQRPPEAAHEFQASADQHREILDGLRSGDPNVAREKFLVSTKKFWANNHQVTINGAKTE